MGKIVVDRGLEEFTIEDKKGNVLGRFEMNPSDFEMYKRYEEVAKSIDSIVDGIKDDDDYLDALIATEQKLYEQFDYLFNANVSKEIFSITSPFTILASGELFIENVLGAIGKMIEVETGKRVTKINSKISKYTKKYHK